MRRVASSVVAAFLICVSGQIVAARAARAQDAQGSAAVGGVLGPQPSRASDEGVSARTTEQVRAQLESVAALPDARHGARALEHARLALERARTFERSGRTAAADRAREIAWASIILASRQIATAHARDAARAAERRAASAERSARAARQALEVALGERARAARQEAR